MPLVGFMFDTTLAAAGLVFSGSWRRHPRIRWILGHLGGAFLTSPKARSRVRSVSRVPRTHRAAAIDYLKKFFYDTVNFDPKALHGVEFAGVNQLLAGSDTRTCQQYGEDAGEHRCLRLSASETARILGAMRKLCTESPLHSDAPVGSVAWRQMEVSMPTLGPRYLLPAPRRCQRARAGTRAA